MIRLICMTLLFAVLLLSCQEKFDRNKWRIKDDLEYPYRENMVRDLTQGHKLIGLKYSQVIDLLGQPNLDEDSVLSYDLYIDYGVEDVQYAKYLKINLVADTVSSFRVEEWQK
jgi:hypothetical protein